MRNISFDNPYLLLIAIPLLAAVIVPFALSIRKDNVSKGVVTSLVLHVLMVCCITLASAGLTFTTVMTETHVYVVTDLSYSSQRVLDQVDEYVREVERSLPLNSKMGVIGFGADQTVITDMGGTFESVKDAKVDDSASNIASALGFAQSLFEENVIKRVVLITDGNETGSNASGLISAIENLHLKGIYLDAIYLDTNIDESVYEVQISEVQFTEHTYEDRLATADALIQSNRDATAIVSLYRGEEKLFEQAEALTKGYNVINFDLNTEEPGTFDYRVEIESDGDVTEQNNFYSFTQQVEDVLEVLLLTESQEDLDQALALYGEKANVDAPLVPDERGQTRRVPFSMEELCFYDEYVISNFDVRTLENRTAIIECLDQAVSRFGKSLVTIGDTSIQNKQEEDDSLANLENMLPVKFGNSARDPKLYAIVLDISHSLSFTNKLQFTRAKRAAKAIVNLLNEQDYIMITPFWGSNTISQAPVPATNRTALERQIDEFTVKQGTMIGPALERTYEMMLSNAQAFSAMELFLITDGLTSNSDTVDRVTLAGEMKEQGIITSTIYAQRGSKPELEEDVDNLGAIKILEDAAVAGGGNHYRIDDNNVDDIMLNDVAENLTESIVLGVAEIDFKYETDGVLKGFTSLPQITGYVNSKAKASATTVLTTKYVSDSGKVTDVPIYAYWSYGSGKVSSFTSAFTGEWVATWSEDDRATTFFKNVLNENIPDEKNGSPYVLTVTPKGGRTDLEIVPVVLNPYATVEVEITAPDGNVTTQLLIFDSQKYSYSFETPKLGKYAVKVVYTDNDLPAPFTSTSYFNLSYAAEYNSFAASDISNLRDVVRNRGTVGTSGKLDLKDENAAVATYEANYTVPLLVAAVVLFVIDIVVRKMKLEDFKMLFRKKKKGGNQ